MNYLEQQEVFYRFMDQQLPHYLLMITLDDPQDYSKEAHSKDIRNRASVYNLWITRGCERSTSLINI